MFSNPAYLFALAGLSIPVMIHFLSRKEGKIIKLGSVRHVVETSTQQFKGIRLNEIMLLILRCTMIIVFSLLLSGLQCTNPGKQKWVLVEQGIGGLQNLNPILDSLEKDGYTLHLMASGFPDLNAVNRDSTEINYWQLVEELKLKNLEQAIVFSKNSISHFEGKRPALPANVRWISQPLPPADFPVKAVRLSDDSLLLLTGHSSSDKTYFTTEKISANTSPIVPAAIDTIKIALVTDSGFNYDRKIIKAALHAIEKLLIVKLTLTESGPSKTSSLPVDWCVWLSPQKVTGITVKKIIQIETQASNELIVQAEPNRWVITSRLNEEVALHNHLTMQLATLFLSEKSLNEKIVAHDRRVIADSLAWSQQEGGVEIQASIQHSAADQYLITLLLAILILERILAYKRNQ